MEEGKITKRQTVRSTWDGIGWQKEKAEQKNMDENDQQLQTVTLLDHIIFDHILPRLPVKPLTRFKSVSKDWYSSLSTAQFAKSQLRFSVSRPRFLIHAVPNYAFLLPYDEHGFEELLVFNDEMITRWNVVVVGSCNGLVCLYRIESEVDDRYFVLWNPATRKRDRIDKLVKGDLHFHGFGYASAIDDYKLVANFSYGDDGDEVTDLYVFSLRDGKWKQFVRLENYDIVLGMRRLIRGLLFDDTLYWCFRVADSPNDKRMFGFDLVKEVEQISMMNCLSRYEDVCLYVMKGRLALHCSSNDRSDLWVPKHRGIWDSWEKLFSIPLTMRVMGLSATDKCLIRYDDDDFMELFLVDPTQNYVVCSEGPPFEFL